MISHNTNVSLGIVGCSLYTLRFFLKANYHQKLLVLTNTPVEFNYMKTLANTFINPATQHQFIQESNFNNAPLRRNAIAMNTNSAFTGSYTKKN